jgi:adenosylmethionine-8-amino-7-oxononanoate aminotransferase
MFAMEHWDVVPDIMTMANGITSSYLPLANTIATPQIADVFAGGDNIFWQALTFGGHPVTAAVALRNIQILEDEGLVESSESIGAYFLEQLHSLRDDHPIIGDVRGIGLLLGVEFVEDRDTRTHFPEEVGLADRLNQAFAEEGLILRTASRKTLSMGPPLCTSAADVEDIVERLGRAIGKVEKGLIKA